MKNSLVILFFVLVSSVMNAQDSSRSLITNDSTYIYKSISAALANPEKVFRLNLSKHKLKKFPEDIFKFKNLRELDLSKNNITEIPKEIGTLLLLEKLELSNNDLVELPDEIGLLHHLQYLGLNRNVIEVLPAAIGNLEVLEILDLWDNELSKIPDELSKLKNLKELELRGILFSEEEQNRIRSLVPEAKVFMSPSCTCKF